MSDVVVFDNVTLNPQSVNVGGFTVLSVVLLRIELLKTVTPTFAQQAVRASSGFDYLQSVVVNPIPFVEEDNEYGGKTVTVGGTNSITNGNETPPANSKRIQTKSASSTYSSQTITPDPGYDYLAQVTLSAIDYTEEDNVAGGKTVILGPVSN